MSSLNFDTESDDFSRPPSLSQSKDSDSPLDSPMTPARPMGDAIEQQPHLGVPQRYNDSSKTPKFGGPSEPSGETGMVNRLRHAASASNLGRSLSRKDRSAPIPQPSPEDSFLPSMAHTAALASGAAGGNSIEASHAEPSSAKTTFDAPATSRGTGIGLLRGRKSSFGDLRKAEKAATADDKRGKTSFWSTLRSKTQSREDPASAPPTTEAFSKIEQNVEAHGPSNTNQTKKLASSKADRLLGHDENERRDLMAQRERQRQAEHLRAVRAMDVLSGSDLVWEPSSADSPGLPGPRGPADHSRPSGWRPEHRANQASASSSGSSRVSERAPVLDSPIGMPSRELSDDFEAILRSQRDSIKGVQDLLNTHKAMVSHLPNLGHHPDDSLSSSSNASWTNGRQSFLPGARAGHTADSSISSSAYASSTRSRSTSLTSSSGPGSRWNDESASVLTMPKFPVGELNSALRGNTDGRRLASNDTSVAVDSSDQFEDADEPPSPHPFAIPVAPKRPAMRTAKTHDSNGNQFSQSARRPQEPMARTVSEQAAPLPRRSQRRSAVQERAAETLRALPPLQSLHKACLVAGSQDRKSPWSDLADLPIVNASSSAECVPVAMGAYLRAYANGEFDISNPPKPRIAQMSQDQDIEGPPSAPVGIGLDLDFPLPPARTGNTPSHSRNGSRAAHSRNASTLSAAFRAVENSLHGDAPDAVAYGQYAYAGVQGDLRAPKPPFEPERARVTQQYLSALGLDGVDPLAQAQRFRNSQLSTIVEALCGLLHVTQVRLQLVSEHESITLVRAGQYPGEDGEAVRTPRVSDGGALGLTLSQSNNSPRLVFPRNSSFDAHVLLSREGSPVVFEDVQRDWRFSARNTAGISFYAAASLLSPEGLPIGTISVADTMSRPGGLARDERSHLLRATQQAMEVLEQSRQDALLDRLASLDESLLTWCSTDHSSKTLSYDKKVDVASPPTPSTIEATLLSLPAGQSGANGMKPPLSPNTLAQRRGAKAPANLALSKSSNFVLPQRPHLEVLNAALRTIAHALKMDLAYIAQVTSTEATSPVRSGKIKCAVVARCDMGQDHPVPINLDGPLHLCAMTASKHGLHLQRDTARVMQLLGLAAGSHRSTTSWGQDDDESFQTAAVVNCGGVRDRGKISSGPDGWVLGVASRDARQHIAPESTIYLLRFASLLGQILIDDARSPGRSSLKSPTSAGRTRARSSSNPTRGFTTPKSPLSPGGPRVRAASPATAKRPLPPLSPPPNEPLPLLPFGASAAMRSPRATVVAMDRSVSNDARPRLPSSLQRPAPMRRAASSAVGAAPNVEGAMGLRDDIEYVSAPRDETSESEASSAALETRVGAGTTSASFLRMPSIARRSHDMLRTVSASTATTIPTTTASALTSAGISPVSFKHSILPSCTSSSGDDTSY